MRKIIGYILVFTPTVLWVGVVWHYEGVYQFLNIALSAVLHECGHLLAFSALGLPMPHITPVARGVRFTAPREMSYRTEAIVASAGPAVNLIAWWLGLMWRDRVPLLYLFGEANLLTALCNLIPILDMDGERILRCILSARLTDRTLYLTMRGVRIIALFLGLFLSLILYWYTGGGIYPAMLCFAALLSADGKQTKSEEKRGKTR